MAADSSQERSEEATPRARRKARERGEVAKSTDLSRAVVLAAGAAALAFTLPDTGASLEAMTRQALQRAANPDPNRDHIIDALAAAAHAGFALLMPIMVAMLVIRSEHLAALMQFGPAEFGLFIVMLLPFSAMIASLNMLAATYGRSYKEAQTYATYLAMAVNFTPIAPLFIAIRDAPWQLLVPAMAQQTVMMKGLRGDTVTAIDILVPGAIAIAITVLALTAQARLLRQERIVFSR